MFQSLSPRWRRLLGSVAYALLITLVGGLGYATYRAVQEHRRGTDASGGAAAGATPFIEIGNFSSRRERSTDAERLTVSLRLRLTAAGAADCYVYIFARNDHVSPKLWSVWPTQGPDGAVTAGGYFRGNNPSSGQAVQLTTGWSRLTATLDHPSGQPPFDTVMVYVVSPKGETLLSRPFAL
jgi:hypothetical protein